MKILLHTCCAPCVIYPARKLKESGYTVHALWYNPNIHPYREYCRRQGALEEYTRREALPVIYAGDYGLKEFIKLVGDGSGKRCARCYQLRLTRTAREARERGFSAFTTTLLESPYQEHELIKSIGEAAARTEKVKFYYQDFRPGHREGLKTAREAGLYCQAYCGCIYSEYERFKGKGADKKKR